MRATASNVITPKRENWESILDGIKIGGSIVIPFSKRNSVANCASLKFHLNTKKRFEVTYKGEKKGEARVTRLKDEIEKTD